MSLFINQWKRVLASLFFIFLVGVGFVFLASKGEKINHEQAEENTSVVDVLQAEPEESTPAQRQAASVSEQAVGAPSTTAKPNSEKNIADWLKSFDQNANWRINRNDQGRVLAVSGGFIKKNMNTNEQALAFAQEFAEQTGVPAKQIVTSMQTLPSSEDSKVMQFDQEIDGYPVLGAYLKVFTRQTDGVVYYITNETQAFADISTEINYSLSQAQEKIAQIYSAKKGVKIESLGEKAVLYSSIPHQAELVWHLQVSVEGPLLDRRDVLVSAKTGQVVRDLTMMKQ